MSSILTNSKRYICRKVTRSVQNILTYVKSGERPATSWLLLLVLCAYVVAGLFLFTVLGTVIGMLVTGGDLDFLINMQTNPEVNPNSRTALLIIQGVSSFGAFVLAPLAFVKINLKERIPTFFQGTFPQGFALSAGILFCFIVVNSVVIQWNANVDLPSFMSGFENWAQEQEAKLADLTKFLTDFQSSGQFVLALIVIAIIPGIGEELLFRGLIQNLFHRTLKNPHVAIWLSAFIFAAFHTQFYGVVPRMLLGALFGYIYLYSGNLLLAMFAHFLNNAFSLVMVYAYNSGNLDINPESSDAVPHWGVILLFAGLCAMGLLAFKNFYRKKNETLASGL